MSDRIASGRYLLGVLAVTCFSSSTAFGQLIAYDGFEQTAYEVDDTPFTLTGPVNDLGNPIVNPGWTDTDTLELSPKWVSTGTQNIQFDLETLSHPSVTYDDMSTGKGKFLAYNNNFGVDFRAVRRALDFYEPADTYYMSFFINAGSVPEGELGQRGQALIGFTNFNVTQETFNNQGGGNIFGLMVGFDGRQNDERVSDLVLRTRQDIGGGDIQFGNTVMLAGEVANPDAAPEAHVSTLENLTHHILVKLEVDPAGITDPITYWVNPSNISSEAAATASAQATGTIDSLAMDQNNRITRVQVAINRFEDRSFFFDEVRLGYDFASVVGTPPSTNLGPPGDYNGNGVVDAADYTLWSDSLGAIVTSGEGADGSLNGTVDIADYDVWVEHFGETALGSAASLSVPEPSSVLLVMFGLLATMGRRRDSSGY